MECATCVGSKTVWFASSSNQSVQITVIRCLSPSPIIMETFPVEPKKITCMAATPSNSLPGAAQSPLMVWMGTSFGRYTHTHDLSTLWSTHNYYVSMSWWLSLSPCSALIKCYLYFFSFSLSPISDSLPFFNPSHPPFPMTPSFPSPLLPPSLLRLLLYSEETKECMRVTQLPYAITCIQWVFMCVCQAILTASSLSHSPTRRYKNRVFVGTTGGTVTVFTQLKGR